MTRTNKQLLTIRREIHETALNIAEPGQRLDLYKALTVWQEENGALAENDINTIFNG